MRTLTFRMAGLMIILLLTISNITLAQIKSEAGKVQRQGDDKVLLLNENNQNNNSDDKILLFNGRDLNNWVFYLKDPSVDPAEVFMIKNGLIHISGNPFGYMRTKETYSDYKLHVEWRWPAEATNSGVFIHGQKPDTIWLRCIECQLKAGSAGDFICMNGADMDEHTNKAVMSVKKMAESSERPVGEWNIMDITCKGNTVQVEVNGVLQNKGTSLNVTSGSICLQSEGKDIEFRNIFLSRLENK